MKFYLSAEGRVCRKDFWLKFVLVLVGVIVAVSLLDSALFPAPAASSFNQSGPLETIANLILLWPQIAVTTKRFHDRNMSGWWQVAFNVVILAGVGLGFASMGAGSGMLVGGIAIAAIAAVTELVMLGFLPGTKGSNKYGDDPLNPAGDLSTVFS